MCFRALPSNMTYTEWSNTHHQKRVTLQQKLEGWGLTHKQVIDYFDYTNMAQYEKDFCPLYQSNTRCHNIDSLNCYLCGCPYFVWSETPIARKEHYDIYSKCSINSKQSDEFRSKDKIHCDCSNCTIPHTKKQALKHYEDLPFVEDSYSLLELIRNFQLADIFGKFKLF